MRVIVFGSRSWRDRGRIQQRLAQLPRGTTVVVGGARGADRIGEAAARSLGFAVELHRAKWSALGRRAGFVRNVEMAEAGGDLGLAFWDGASSGTSMMIRICRDHDIPVEVHHKKKGMLWNP